MLVPRIKRDSYLGEHYHSVLLWWQVLAWEREDWHRDCLCRDRSGLDPSATVASLFPQKNAYFFLPLFPVGSGLRTKQGPIRTGRAGCKQGVLRIAQCRVWPQAEDGSSSLLWRPHAGLAKWEAKNCIQWERDRVCHNTADNRRSRDTQL